MRGQIRRRLALALVLTALTPVLTAIWLSRSMLRQTTDRFFLPEVGERLEQSLELYNELAAATKARMRSAARAISLDPHLAAALQHEPDAEEVSRLLRAHISSSQGLVSLRVEDDQGQLLAEATRGTPVDEQRELPLHVTQPLPRDLALHALFAAKRARFDQLEDMSQFVQTYARVEARRDTDERTYVYAFAALLGFTIIAGVGIGGLLAQGVSGRVSRLARATERVGAGDLGVRISVTGNDELTELAEAFNRMLEELEQNRSRIEYLQRLAAWQGMARRLAHEIKNPLTPIQLAVQELHQRSKSEDPAFRALANTTREIVESEVQTLRRLVSEFSDFARLPVARLSEDDLLVYLRELEEQLGLLDGVDSDTTTMESLSGVRLEFDLPSTGALPAALDRTMFRRALMNLIDNAARAARKSEAGGRVVVSARLLPHGRSQVSVEDNGPGVPERLRATIFDPYVTHEEGGTGLGLAIVKKIVIEHHGTIQVGSSRLGGAAMQISLPELGKALLEAASVRDDRHDWPPSSRR